MEIVDILKKLLIHFELKTYPSLCSCASTNLTSDEQKEFEKFYNKSVKNRKVFYWRNHEKVNEDDLYGTHCPQDRTQWYLFRPYDKYRRIKWLKSQIEKLSK
jgi:hypothetical protein